MKKIIYIAAIAAMLLALGTVDASAQKKLRIGKTEIILQTPLKIYDSKEVVDTVKVPITITTVKSTDGKIVEKTAHYGKSHKVIRNYSRTFTDFYFGMGMFTNGAFGGEKYYPTVQYGKAFDLQTGLKFFYRPARWFAIGTQIQYSYYSYRIDGASQNGFIGEPLPADITAEYFRSDNAGTALLNRFWLFRNNSLEIGVYGDYSFSKRYVVKTLSDGKQKYRDCNRFTPLQAGVQVSLNLDWFCIYTKYRITNMFNHDLLPLGPPRWTVGAMIQF